MISTACTWLGDAGASALAAALGRGALPRLKQLFLYNTALGDAGLVALAPALRRRPALEGLKISGNPFGDEGLAALLAPPPPAAGTPPRPAGGLKKLEELDIEETLITDAGCATLAAALDSGALPALEKLGLASIPASDEAKAAVYEARANLRGAEIVTDDEDEDEGEDEWGVDEWDEYEYEDEWIEDESGEDEWDEDEGS